jgi:hypothetical protein
MYVPPAMLMCNQVVLKEASAFTAHPAAVALPPYRFLAAFIIKSLNAALVWPACGQSEEK